MMDSHTLECYRNHHGTETELADRNDSCFGSMRPLFTMITKKMLIISLLLIVLSLSSNVSMAEVEIIEGSTIIDIFNSEDDLASSLANYIANLSKKYVKESGTFTIVLSGDSLITSMRKLLEKPYVDSIDWAKWYVFWVDERVVPKKSPLSNYRNAYDNFLSKVPIRKNHTISIDDKLSVEEAAADYEARLKQLTESNVISMSNTSGCPSFDVMLLGVGPDGHVASLFPDHPQIENNEDWVTYITDSPKPPPQRITMTLPVIKSSKNIAFVVTGSDKAKVTRVALDGYRINSKELPVHKVSPQGDLRWFIDDEAGVMLMA